MSLGWLSEPAVLPSQSKEIPVDPASTRELAQAVFNKETEARQYGAVITTRQKITTLRNQQKQFIENQNVAKRDEFIRQQTELKNKQRMQHKINKYQSILRGDSNVVSNEYLVDFEAKGIDVTTEDHEITLMNVRYERNKNKIDYELYPDMVADSDEIANKSQKKMTFEDKMKTHLSDRKQLIIDAKKRKQNFMQHIKAGTIDSLIKEMSEMERKNKINIRKKPIFTNKMKTATKQKSFVHKRIEMEVKNKKRKFDETENDSQSVSISPVTKKFKAKRVDKECDYAAIPPPTHLYANNKGKSNEYKKETMEVSDNNNPSEFQSTTMHQTYPQQTYPYPYGLNYNPYLHGYNPYMNPYHQNMQYPYPYYHPQMSQYPYPSQIPQTNPFIPNTNPNNIEPTKQKDDS